MNSTSRDKFSPDLLKWLSPDALAAAKRAMQTRVFRDGQIIYAQDDNSDETYRIVSGAVRLSSTRPDGQTYSQILFEKGTCFGINNLIDDEPRLQTAEARGTTKLQILAKPAIIEIRKDFPHVDGALLRYFNSRLRYIGKLFIGLYLDEMSDRLIRLIVYIANASGVACEEGIRLPRHLSQAELATMVGTPRQAVNRTLRRFQEQGLLTIRYGSLIIRDLGKLEAREKTSAPAHKTSVRKRRTSVGNR